jgi:fused signal recognition particle receptor
MFDPNSILARMSNSQPSVFSRLSKGLSKSSAQLTQQVVAVLTKVKLDQAQLDALEDLLIEADLGPQAAARVTEAFGRNRFGREISEEDVRQGLADAIAAELSPHQGRFDPLGSSRRPYVVLFVGVNGSGKTTTLGKIAADLKGRGASVLIAAGDGRHVPRGRDRATQGLGRARRRSGAGQVDRRGRFGPGL